MLGRAVWRLRRVSNTFLLGTEKNTIDDAVAGAEGCTLHLDTDSSRQQRVESIGSIRLLEP
jgi:hypothetical protein